MLSSAIFCPRQYISVLLLSCFVPTGGHALPGPKGLRQLHYLSLPLDRPPALGVGAVGRVGEQANGIASRENLNPSTRARGLAQPSRACLLRAH